MENKGIDEMFTEAQLKAFIQGEVVGDRYPYDTPEEQVLINYLNPIQEEMKRQHIQCRLASDHFDSGYASYIQLLCYEKEHQLIEGNEVTIKGLHVLVSRLAPVIVIGQAEETSCYDEDGEEETSSYTLLSHPQQLELETTSLQQLAQKLERLFMKYHLTILHKEDVDKALPFKAKIPTIFRKPKDYLIWDAIFYWED